MKSLIAILSLAGIALHLVLRFVPSAGATVYSIPIRELPLIAVLAAGGLPLVLELAALLARREFKSDLLAGISIVTAVVLGEYLAGAIVVLMLSGGEALEGYAVRGASSVLEALAKRMPAIAHRRQDGQTTDVPLGELEIGDVLVVFPHETCPVDGIVLEGHGVMDESYLTGEPYMMSKTPGSTVLSGSINGETALTVRAEKRVIDSRYAKIMQVMRQSEQQRPRMRRIGDQLGAVYTPIAVGLALAAWAATGEAVRFLAVLVVATPCPLLIAIPVAIIGSISLAARRGIVIKDPAVLEKMATCGVAIFDKTGTLTYGKPKLTQMSVAAGFDRDEVMRLVASLERYSKHPLAAAILSEAQDGGLEWTEASEVHERPGEGLRGVVAGRSVQVTSRNKLSAANAEAAASLWPAPEGGMECIILVDGRLAAACHFRDQPRLDAATFVRHLGPRHRLDRVMLVSGDRASEVRYLAEAAGIREVHAEQSPEQKLELVRAETARANTLFLGDGINDAPAMTAATVGIAFGANNDIASEAAGAVVLDSSLQKVDELLHVGRRLRSIALQSAIGGMALSLVGMLFAAAGYLTPVAGAVVQEVIDVAAVANALRIAIVPKKISDY